MRIGIIGAGKIGSELAAYFILQNGIKQIDLFSRNIKELKGRIDSLKLYAYSLGSKCEIGEISFDYLKKYDHIVICIKDNYDPRRLMHSVPSTSYPHNLRYVGLSRDYPLIIDLCANLVDYKGAISIITNPVEIISSLVKTLLPSAQVFGLGLSIDSARLGFFYELNNSESEIVLYGEHGMELNAVDSLWPIMLDKSVLQRNLARATRFGYDLVDNLGFTLHDCIPSFAKDIYYIMRNKSLAYRSISYPTETLLISRPILIMGSKVLEFEDYSKVEKEEMHLINSSLLKIDSLLKRRYNINNS